jgi:N-sulfoglucosamine sulfohydrolase
VRNVAKDDAYAEILADLRLKLESWQVQTNDLWLYRDGVSVILNRRHMAAGLSMPDRFDIDVDNSKGTGNKPYQDPWQRM